MKTKPISLAPALTVGLVIAVCVFAFGNMRDLLFGSPLSVRIAPDGTTLSDGFLPVSGKAKHARSVSVNGRPLAIDREGHFSDGVILSPGYNVVEVALQNQFGKQKVKIYRLVLDQTSTVASAREEPARYQQ